MIGVLGGGAWGTALAQMLASDGTAVRLWAFEADLVDAINQAHENPLYLPGIPLSPAITATNDAADLGGCDTILVVAPAQHVGALIGGVPDRGQPLILCSKGMEQGSARLMNEVVEDAGWSGPVAVLSGPTFAHEVARGIDDAPLHTPIACGQVVPLQPGHEHSHHERRIPMCRGGSQ